MKTDNTNTDADESWFWLVKLAFTVGFALISTFLTTLAYVVVVSLLFGTGQLGFALGLCVLLLPFAFAVSRPYGVLLWDYRRWRLRRRNRAELALGNDWLRMVGLVRDDDDTVYPVRHVETPEEIRIVIEKAMPGVSSPRLVKIGDEYRTLYDAKRVRVDDLGKGALALRFVRVTATDTATPITEPAPLDPETMGTTIGLDSDGEPVALKLKGDTGMTISGLAGSGKTVGCISLLSSLVSPYSRVHIVDLKGGGDLSPLTPVISTYLEPALSGDLTAVVDFLVSQEQAMRDRIAANKQAGIGNAWDLSAADRLAAGLTVEVIFIDEAHILFDTRAVSDKEEKARREKARNSVEQLLRLGRSSLFFVILATQKMTTESVPSSVRDNCALKIACRLATGDAEKAALGETAEGLETVRATDIPNDEKGGAVIVDGESGERRRFRFYYFADADLKKWVERESNLVCSTLDHSAPAF